MSSSERIAANDCQDRTMTPDEREQFGYSQCQAIGEPAYKTWDEYERGCLMTYSGGYHEPSTRDAFRHGMSTVFNLLRAEFPEAHVCKAASPPPALGEKPWPPGELLETLRSAYEFVITACQENVQIEGFDPSSHVLAIRIRKLIAALKENAAPSPAPPAERDNSGEERPARPLMLLAKRGDMCGDPGWVWWQRVNDHPRRPLPLGPWSYVQWDEVSTTSRYAESRQFTGVDRELSDDAALALYDRERASQSATEGRG